MLKQWLFAALVAGGISATGADYSKELAEIKAGQRTEARASWWGFDKTNATQYLQAALDSGVKKLIIDQTAATGSLIRSSCPAIRKSFWKRMSVSSPGAEDSRAFATA